MLCAGRVLALVLARVLVLALRVEQPLVALAVEAGLQSAMASVRIGRWKARDKARGRGECMRTVCGRGECAQQAVVYMWVVGSGAVAEGM